MFGKVWKWAGVFRTHDLNIGVPWQHIETKLEVLLGNLRAWQEGDMPLIEQAARLHHQAVFIHPFENGNGRWSRLLASIWQKLHGQKTTEWPAATSSTHPEESRIREEYLAAIRSADAGDLEALIELHRRYTQ
jgi:fido (protein-threonine AMPylation protein)